MEECTICLPWEKGATGAATASERRGPAYYPCKVKVNKVREESLAVAIVERTVDVGDGDGGDGTSEYLVVQRPSKGTTKIYRLRGASDLFWKITYT